MGFCDVVCGVLWWFVVFSATPRVIFRDCTVRFVSDLIGNPEDRFSRIEAHMYNVNKGAARQCCHRTADLHLCFRTHLMQVFSWCVSFSTIPTLLSPIILSFMNLRLRMLGFFSFGYLFIHLFFHLSILSYFFFFFFYVIFNYLLIYLYF